MKQIKLLRLFSVLPIGIGVGIYLLRSLSLPSWVKYNLPDGLWLFAFINTLSVVWVSAQKQWFAWTAIVFALAVLSEYLQRLQIIPGTYDILDIVAYLIAALFSISIHLTTDIFKKPIHI